MVNVLGFLYRMQVKNIVAKVVSGLGYHAGRGSNWYRDFPDLIHVVGLQKSRWGGANYLESGIWLKTFGPDELPNYYECHVRLRLSVNSGLDVGDIDSALQGEDLWKMDSDERMRILTTALKRAEAAFLNKARTLNELQKFLGGRHNLNLAIDRRVKELFGTDGS
jgi:hypothetical protein